MKATAALLAVALLSLASCSRTTSVSVDNAQDHLILLDTGWTYELVKDTSFAGRHESGLRDNSINPTLDVHQFLSAHPAPTNGWLHNFIQIPDYWPDTPIALTVLQSVASEIFLNGKSIAAYGRIDPTGLNTREYDPLLRPIPISVVPGGSYQLDVHFGLAKGTRYTTVFEFPNPLFRAEIKPMSDAIDENNRIHNIETGFLLLNLGINIMFFIIHFFFFILNRSEIANLFLSISGLVYIIGSTIQLQYFLYTPHHTDRYILGNITFFLYQFGNMLLFLAVHHFLERKRDIVFWVLTIYFFVALVLNLSWYGRGWQVGGAFYQLTVIAGVLLISLHGWFKGKKGAVMFSIGSCLSLIFFTIFAIQGTFEQEALFLRTLTTFRGFLYLSFWLTIIASVSAYLAWDFSLTSNSLSKKLKEVELLSNKNMEMEREKRVMLARQNQELEEKVLERTSALNQSLEHLKSTQSQLIQAEKMASLGELTAGIAHEIQNPLNFVNNFSQLNGELSEEILQAAEKGDLGEIKVIANDIKSNQEKINEHGRRAEVIVKSMLQHSRSSSGQKEPRDINKLVDEYVHLAYHGFRAREKDFNATLDLDFDPQAGLVNMVAQDIGRVLLNLLNNAFYAVSEKNKLQGPGFVGVIKVHTKKKDNLIEITVTDNGNGIPEKVLDKVFQPFFTTKPTGQGTGLGLSLSYDIIKAHSGQIKIRNTPGAGAEFIITLPIEK